MYKLERSHTGVTILGVVGWCWCQRNVADDRHCRCPYTDPLLLISFFISSDSSPSPSLPITTRMVMVAWEVGVMRAGR